VTCSNSPCRYDGHLLLEQVAVESGIDTGLGPSEGGSLAGEHQTQPELDTGGYVDKDGRCDHRCHPRQWCQKHTVDKVSKDARSVSVLAPLQELWPTIQRLSCRRSILCVDILSNSVLLRKYVLGISRKDTN